MKNIFTAPFRAAQKGVDKVTQEVVMGIVRHVLGAIGSAYVTSGVITGEQKSDAIGALIVLCTVAWSILKNRKQAKLKEA